MQITLTPLRGFPGQPDTAIVVLGDTLIVDGSLYDLSQVPEAGEADATGEHPFVGPIQRKSGVIHCTLRVVLGDDAVPEQPGSPWTVSVADGPVTIPAIRIEEIQPSPSP